MEVALSRLLRRSPKPRELEVIEEFAVELPERIAVSTIENLVDDPPDKDRFGVLLAQLTDAKRAMRPRNGRIGPARNPLNDYDALAEGSS